MRRVKAGEEPALEAERGNIGCQGLPVHDGSGEVGVTHLGDMSEEGVELLVGVEDAILSEVPRWSTRRCSA
jgi:hypothetical protein